MKKNKTSIKDIAKKLNISITTVSFVLNGKGKEKNISDKTIKKIVDYIDEIDYKPNLVARSLRTGESKVLVFMVEDISNNFFAKIARIVEEIAHKKGYKLLFCSNENNDTLSKELINLFIDRQVDGFLITPSAGIKPDIEKLINSGIPVVLFDRYFKDLNSNYVIIDNFEASYTATSHLLQNGFKKTALLTIDVEQSQMTERQNGYKSAMTDYGLEPIIIKVPFDDKMKSNCKSLLKSFFKKDNAFDSILFCTNYLTQCGLEELQKINPELIEKIGMITFDDNDFFKIFNPPISCMNQPLKQMGEELMSIMLNLLKKRNQLDEPTQVILKANLIQRNSSMHPDLR